MSRKQYDMAASTFFRRCGDLGDLGKENVEALLESSKLAAKGFESLGMEVTTYARAMAAFNMDAAKAMADAKSLPEMITLQTQFWQGGLDRAMAEGSKLAGMWLQATNEAARPVKACVHDTLERVTRPAVD